MLEQPRCSERKCTHYRGISGVLGREDVQRPVCIAFPAGIPREIAYGLNLHLMPVKGDNGIMFERGAYRPDADTT